MILQLKRKLNVWAGPVLPSSPANGRTHSSASRGESALSALRPRPFWVPRASGLTFFWNAPITRPSELPEETPAYSLVSRSWMRRFGWLRTWMVGLSAVLPGCLEPHADRVVHPLPDPPV